MCDVSLCGIGNHPCVNRPCVVCCRVNAEQPSLECSHALNDLITDMRQRHAAATVAAPDRCIPSGVAVTSETRTVAAVPDDSGAGAASVLTQCAQAGSGCHASFDNTAVAHQHSDQHSGMPSDLRSMSSSQATSDVGSQCSDVLVGDHCRSALPLSVRRAVLHAVSVVPPTSTVGVAFQSLHDDVVSAAGSEDDDPFAASPSPSPTASPVVGFTLQHDALMFS